MILDSETRHEIAKLRIAHDKAVAALYRQYKARGAEMLTIALDPEMIYHLDAQDAILELYDDEECLA
jgi:hypothetical protein